MKNVKCALYFMAALALSLNSCTTSEDPNFNPALDSVITANSPVALFIAKTVANDGSVDNIIDSANCFSVQFPVTVTVNGTTLTINNAAGYDDIEDLIDLTDNDVDLIVITYPITVILADFTTVVINNDAALFALAATCNDEDEDDDDIECIDFLYPISVSVFDTNNVLVATITVNDDNAMYNLIDDLDDFRSAAFIFPITVILADGTNQTINNVTELLNAIEAADDTCDEDDDYDYDDDDCDTCTTAVLDNLFAGCVNWDVDKLTRGTNDLQSNYNGYIFTFNSNGTITVVQNTTTWTGTWSATGTGNNMTVTINITGLPDFNDTWDLHEVERESGEAEIELRLGTDRLSFESDC